MNIDIVIENNKNKIEKERGKKNMKKRKGFTLVELLAVIAILAILVIMALPAILRMYRQSRINNFQNEVRSVYRTAQSQFLGDSINLESGEKILYTNAESCSPSGITEVKELEMTGNSDFKYYVEIDVYGKVLTVKASNGTYSYIKTGTDLKIEEIEVENGNGTTLDSNIASDICTATGSSSGSGSSVTNAATCVETGCTKTTVGTLLELAGEQFYVIDSNPNKTKLLAKYNLYVGEIYNNDYSLNSVINSSESGYGLQSSTTIGWESGANLYKGTVPFSGTNYWDESVCQYTNTTWGCTGDEGLKSKYATNGSSYDGNPFPYVYESNMSSTAPSLVYGESNTFHGWGHPQNNGYTIAYYVEQYVNKLKTLGAPNDITGKLMSYEEFKNTLRYDIDENQCNIGLKSVLMSAYSLDESSAEYMASVLCSGGEVDGSTLHDIIFYDETPSEYYSYIGLSNVIKPNYLFTSTYWLGSATGDCHVWCVSTNDGNGGNGFSSPYAAGVRPVIVVNTSSL